MLFDRHHPSLAESVLGSIGVHNFENGRLEVEINMKIKFKILIALFVISIMGNIFLCFLCNKPGANTEISEVDLKLKYDKQLEQDNGEDEDFIKKGAIARIDYPLIDIYFEAEKQYKIVITEYMQDKVYKEYEDKGVFFQNNKENISIITVPCGMGTTTKYTFSVYEGENCIKTLDCQEIRTGILDNKWKNSEK